MQQILSAGDLARPLQRLLDRAQLQAEPTQAFGVGTAQLVGGQRLRQAQRGQRIVADRFQRVLPEVRLAREDQLCWRWTLDSSKVRV